MNSTGESGNLVGDFGDRTAAITYISTAIHKIVVGSYLPYYIPFYDTSKSVKGASLTIARVPVFPPILRVIPFSIPVSPPSFLT